MRFFGKAFVLVLFSAYLFFWIQGNGAWLFDLSVQQGDASLFLAPFHWFGQPSTTLPLFVEESRFLIPPAFELLYRGLLFGVDLPTASKIVQGFCLLLIFASGGIVWRFSSPRNLSLGLFFVFFLLHTSFVVNRIAGGLPRAFCFPLLAFWGASRLAETHKNKIVFLSIVLGALFYPPVVMMILVTEILLLLSNNNFLSIKTRLKTGLLLVGLGMVFLLPFLVRIKSAGPMTSFSEAKKDYAFSIRPLGKERVFPLPDPGKAAFYFSLPLTPLEGEPFSAWPGRIHWEHDSTYALLFFAVLVFLVLVRLSKPPRFSLLFLAGSLVCYASSLFLGLYLYWPDTYFYYGVLLSGIFFVVEILHRGRWSVRLNEFVVSFFALLVLALTGSGIVAGNGMDINENKLSSLYSRISLLPADSLIAAHPVDANAIPYFTGRGVVVSAKTLQPLLKKVWEVQKVRTFDLLDALYARDPMTIVTFNRRYGATHFLINEERYRPDFLERLKFMEPFDSIMQQYLKSFGRASPVWENIPSGVIEFRESGFIMVNVKKLLEAWGYPY